ncbi:uncharacterized protein LOC142224223 [Haematobia irritans]|uniref:uncharacterized protein LOC142224223 n=1 Tax=Haematobia irritans TaxID=7368 RepID=UPI003F4F5230
MQSCKDIIIIILNAKTCHYFNDGLHTMNITASSSEICSQENTADCIHWFKMPRIIKNRFSTNDRITHYNRQAFQCRICKKFHPLRACKKFLSMSTQQRKQAVEKYRYCLNCLAHEHSMQGCFSNSGCHVCGKSHHTLLHDNRARTSRRPELELSSATNYLVPTTVTILPTALVKIAHNGRLHQIRALIDTGSIISRIAKTMITKLGISTSHMENTTMCQLTIRAISDAKARVSATFRVDNRMTMKTPSHSLSSSFRERFLNLILADPTFNESAPISMVLGADIYPKIILGGVIPNHEGVPMAQNSIFGWLVSGTCPM